jgi:hypothetical protein
VKSFEPTRLIWQDRNCIVIADSCSAKGSDDGRLNVRDPKGTLRLKADNKGDVMRWRRSKKFWKVASNVFVAAGAPFVVAWLWLLEAISRSPLQPIPPSNLIPFNNHGHDVYITKFQSDLLASFTDGRLGLAYLLLVAFAFAAAWIADKSPK